ncbi:unnamed protein product [Somion occarium]|uniref:AMP binding protein n=1 Tax=Somion occarium TaxID=3059160 RepID=A0ABP1DWP5_9APHY
MRIYKSTLPPVETREESIFTHLFATTYSNHPSSLPAFTDAATGLTLTRAELKKLSLSLGYGLRQEFSKLGGVTLDRGETIMIFSPNSIAWPVMVFGSLAPGLRTTLANSSYTAGELEHQWKDSGAKAVFVQPALLSTALEMFKYLGLDLSQARRRIILADFGIPSSEQLPAGFVKLSDLLGKGSLNEEEKFPGKQSNETAYLCYSSGTTGKPKGVETTHFNIVAVINIVRALYPKTVPGEDVMLGVLPFYHIYGSVKLLLFQFLLGVQVVIMSKFDPVEFCRNTEKYKVTIALIVPPICLAIIHHPATTKFNMKSLKYLTSGAAPLSGELAQATREKLKSVGASTLINQGYGLTETSPTTHLCPMEEAIKRPKSVGLLLPNLEARLVNDDVNDVEDGESGELWVRGPSVMKGYLNNEEATTNAITPDGWFKTGDIAVRDKDGYWYIVDRRKELIKYKGFQVPPAELEAILLTHPQIVDVAVIGINSEKDATELPRAYVVHAKAIRGDAARQFGKEVQKWIQSRVARHKYLRGGVIVIDAIPKSAAGKILRRELRELAKKEILSSPEFKAKL